MKFRLGDIVGIKENKFVVQSARIEYGAMPIYDISDGEHKLCLLEDELKLLPLEKKVENKTIAIIDFIMGVYGLKFDQAFRCGDMQGYAFFTDDYCIYVENNDDFRKILHYLVFRPESFELKNPIQLMTHDQIAAALGHDFELVEESNEKE